MQMTAGPSDVLRVDRTFESCLGTRAQLGSCFHYETADLHESWGGLSTSLFFFNKVIGGGSFFSAPALPHFLSYHVPLCANGP